MSYKIRQADTDGIMRDVTVNGNALRGFDFPPDSVELKEFDEKTRSFLAVASTEESDRVADKVSIKGIDLDNYMKNPVVMWAHDYRQLPLGISLDVEKNTRKKQLIFRPSFDDHEFAVKVYNSYLKRIMRGFSIGAIPLEYVRRSEDDMSDEEKSRAGFFGGWAFNRTELLEVSAAPIPMNPDALSAMKAMGFSEYVPSEIGLENVKCLLADGSIWMPITDCSAFSSISMVKVDEKVKVVSGKPLGSGGSDVVIQRVLGYIFPHDFTDDAINEWFMNKGLSNETVTNFLQFSQTQEIDPLVLTIADNKPTLDIITIKMGICGSSSLPTTDKGSWDGAGAQGRMWEKGVSTYRKGHVWLKEGKDPQLKGSYSMPFADVINGRLTAVWGGVKAAMAATHGARNKPEGDRKAMHTFLAKYYKKFGQEVPEFKSYSDEELIATFGCITTLDENDNIVITMDKKDQITMEVEVNKEDLQVFIETVKTLTEQVSLISKMVEDLKKEFETFKTKPEPSVPSEDESGVLNLIEEVVKERNQTIEFDESTQQMLKEVFTEVFTKSIDDKVASAVEEALRAAQGEIKD